ncbi:MAG: hypothetical protein MJY53_01130 [Bacteroidales bacterium]|nr:hypothetical protein [Bacteroidales bacterium]
MKKIFKIFAVVSVFAGLVSCVKYADYKTVPFASADVSSAKITEPAVGEPAVTYKLPVHVYNATSDCAVSYEIKDVTAKQGVDYTVIGGTGVLNFAKGVETQEIEFSITGQPGIFTGDVNFQVILKEATNNVTLGSINTARITIADKDHPLVDLFGDYTYYTVDVNTNGAYSYINWDTILSEFPGDVTKINIENPFYACLGYASYIPGTIKLWGYVNEEHTEIRCPLPQDTGITSANMFGYDNFVIFGWSGTNIANGACVTEPYEVVWTLSEDGAWVTENPFQLNCYGYQSEAPGDWLYYYMNCLAQFNPNYPTYFIKK